MRSSLLLIALFAGAALATDQPAPNVKSASPDFMQRGASTEVTFTGEGLAPDTKILVSGEPGLTANIVEATPTKVRVAITATADAQIGDREIRLVTPGGVSTALNFNLSMFPVIAEKEPNNKFDVAQPIELPVTVVGSINAAAEVDCFKFSAKKGEELVFDVQASRIGSKLDSSLRVFDSAGHELACSFDGADVDSTIEFKAPADGEFFLQLHDVKYGGGGDFNYRLTAGRIPYADSIFPMGGQRGQQVEVSFSGQNMDGNAKLSLKLDPAVPLGRMDVRASTPLGQTNPMPFEVSDLPEFIEQEPNNAVDKATPVTVPSILNGRINERRDRDVYKFKTEKGQKLVFEVVSGRLGSQLDPLLTLFNAKGDVLLQNEADGRFEYTFNDAAEYAIGVQDLHERSGPGLNYRLAVQPPASGAPSFSVRFTPDRLAVSRGGRSIIQCEITRDGNYDGDITVAFEGLPKGISAEPVTIPNKPEGSGLVSISAAEDAEMGSFQIRVVASSKFKDQTITRTASPELNSQTVRQAYLTVLNKAAFTIEPVEASGEDDTKAVQAQIAELEKGLDANSPAFTAALAKWETGQAGGTKWTVLEAEKLISAAYAKTDKRPDGSVIVSGGNPAKDTYKLVLKTKLRGITAFQLEALADPALPAQGPGRAENGNFVLTNFKVDAAPISDENKILNIQFAKATADFSQAGFPVENALLNKPDAGWAIAPEFGKTHKALFECAKPIDYEGGAVLTITLDHASPHNQHVIGCFRVSATTDKTPSAGGKILPANVQAALDVAADKRDDKQKKDLAMYFKAIDPEMKKLEERIAALKGSASVRYPPVLHRNAASTLAIKVKRSPEFKGPITLTAEGYSSGRDPQTKKPFTIAKSIDVKPVTIPAEESLGVLSMRAVPKGDTGTRTIVVRAEAKDGTASVTQFSKLVPLTIGAAMPDDKPKAADKTPELIAGLDYKYFEGDWDLIPDFDGMTPKESGAADKFDLSKRKRDDMFGFKFSGFIDIKAEGKYTFYLASDDGSRLYIGPYEVIDNDGLHGADEKKGDIKLKPGKHAISIHFFEKTGGEALTVSYEGTGVTKQEIPATVLFREKK
jgi:hypothetical protein